MPRGKKSADFSLSVSKEVLPALSVGVFATAMMETPESHSEFEWQELPEPEVSVSSYVMPWDDPEQLPFLQSLPNPLTYDLFIFHFVRQSKEECEHACDNKQRSAGWHRARAFCITASQFGSTMGHNKYLSRPALCRQKLHPHLNPLSSNFAQWGVDHEKHAEEAFRLFLQNEIGGMYSIEHPNVLKHEDVPWLACSPDGILYRREHGVDVTELIEYKAPAYHRNKTGHPYSKETYNVPKAYMDQMQGTMWLMRHYNVAKNGMNVQRCWFVVWQPHALYVTHVPYLETYADQLMATVMDFYTKDFVPGCIKEIETVLNKNK